VEPAAEAAVDDGASATEIAGEEPPAVDDEPSGDE
jgi:hypothetical protein